MDGAWFSRRRKSVGRRDEEEEERNGSITFAPFDILFPVASSLHLLRLVARSQRPMLHSQGLTWANGVRNVGRNKAQIRGTTGWKEEKRSKPDSWLYHRYNQSETERRGGCPLSRVGDEGHFEVFFTTINNPERTSFLSKL